MYVYTRLRAHTRIVCICIMYIAMGVRALKSLRNSRFLLSLLLRAALLIHPVGGPGGSLSVINAVYSKL